MQNSGQVPSASKHVPNPALRKGEEICPEEQRLLSVLSAWFYSWEVPNYRKLDSWRRKWSHPTSFGATSGARLSDVSTSLALQVEWSRHTENWVHGLALDRKKVFRPADDQYMHRTSTTRRVPRECASSP
eukprot:7523009-Pyramimonas_sp.AAC.1